jgi:hypothetical protein
MVHRSLTTRQATQIRLGIDLARLQLHWFSRGASLHVELDSRPMLTLRAYTRTLRRFVATSRGRRPDAGRELAHLQLDLEFERARAHEGF